MAVGDNKVTRAAVRLLTQRLGTLVNERRIELHQWHGFCVDAHVWVEGAGRTIVAVCCDAMTDGAKNQHYLQLQPYTVGRNSSLSEKYGHVLAVTEALKRKLGPDLVYEGVKATIVKGEGKNASQIFWAFDDAPHRGASWTAEDIATRHERFLLDMVGILPTVPFPEAQ